MKIYHCSFCDQLVFFENTACLSCGNKLAYLPDQAEMGTLKPDGDDLYRSVSRGGEERQYRLCRNYTDHNVCNWVVPADDPNPYCQSCRLTQTIPDLSQPGTLELWSKLETAKRRLIANLIRMELPLRGRVEDPEEGLAFQFLADSGPDAPVTRTILTGHEDGVITINIAEADDPEREKRRSLMHEPYRTLLGHFRHEIGHYYWDRLIADSPQIDTFRELFGDERLDYAQALQRHHKDGAPADWTSSFISAYASAHAWEDWAETWAHYLHITDTLETAVACGLSLRPKRSDEPILKPDLSLTGSRRSPFDQIIERWFPLTYVLNNLNRGMGLQDAYPFVLSPPALEKLRYVHEVVSGAVPKRGDLAGSPTKPGYADQDPTASPNAPAVAAAAS